MAPRLDPSLKERIDLGEPPSLGTLLAGDEAVELRGDASQGRERG